MSDWSEEKCLLLIYAYRENTLLWSPKDKNYYRKPLKEDAWAKIGGVMNESGATCRQKVINLLASYRRERMKIRKSVGTGKGKDEIYESKWYAFKALGFLNDRITSRKGLEAGDANEQVEESEDNKEDNATSSPPSLEPPNKKLKSDPKLQMRKEAFGILKDTANKQSNQDNELKSFFDFIQEKMKVYSRDTKNAIQHEIFQIIMQADQGYYCSLQNCGYYSATQNQESPQNSNSSIATNKETHCVILNTSRPSSTSSQKHSPHSNSSQYSSEINFKNEDDEI